MQNNHSFLLWHLVDTDVHETIISEDTHTKSIFYAKPSLEFMIYHEKPVTIASDSYCVRPGSACVCVGVSEGGVGGYLITFYTGRIGAEAQTKKTPLSCI